MDNTPRGIYPPDVRRQRWARFMLSLWADLQWRHHGLGMLQAYRPNDRIVRFHVFAHELTHPARLHDGRIHNHRYSILSSVVTGAIVDTPVYVCPSTSGPYGVYVFDAASESTADDITLLCGAHVHAGQRSRTPPGHSYEIQLFGYHESDHVPDSNGVAITIVERGDMVSNARASTVAHNRPVPGIQHESIAEWCRGTDTRPVLQRAHLSLVTIANGGRP